jgi:hypothetical protein
MHEFSKLSFISNAILSRRTNIGHHKMATEARTSTVSLQKIQIFAKTDNTGVDFYLQLKSTILHMLNIMNYPSYNSK